MAILGLCRINCKAQGWMNWDHGMPNTLWTSRTSGLGFGTALNLVVCALGDHPDAQEASERFGVGVRGFEPQFLGGAMGSHLGTAPNHTMPIQTTTTPSQSQAANPNQTEPKPHQSGRQSKPQAPHPGAAPWSARPLRQSGWPHPGGAQRGHALGEQGWAKATARGAQLPVLEENTHAVFCPVAQALVFLQHIYIYIYILLLFVWFSSDGGLGFCLKAAFGFKGR